MAKKGRQIFYQKIEIATIALNSKHHPMGSGNILLQTGEWQASWRSQHKINSNRNTAKTTLNSTFSQSSYFFSGTEQLIGWKVDDQIKGTICTGASLQSASILKLSCILVHCFLIAVNIICQPNYDSWMKIRYVVTHISVPQTNNIIYKFFQ